LIDVNQRPWHKYLYDALFLYNTTKKRETRLSPSKIHYGTEEVFLVPIELFSLKLHNAIENHEFKDALEKRILYLTKLEEEKEVVVDRI